LDTFPTRCKAIDRCETVGFSQENLRLTPPAGKTLLACENHDMSHVDVNF